MIDWTAIGGLIAKAYGALEDLISTLLAETLFKARPELAGEFAGAISLLVSLTVLYIILALVAAAKKVIGIILALGWTLLLIAFALTLLPAP